MNGRRCDSLITSKGGFNNLSLSSSQFISSTGECALIGGSEQQRKTFVLANLDNLNEDFAKGSGEYSLTFAKMHGCSDIAPDRYAAIMKFNFETLLEIEQTENAEALFEYLERPFKNDSILISACNLTT